MQEELILIKFINRVEELCVNCRNGQRLSIHDKLEKLNTSKLYEREIIFNMGCIKIYYNSKKILTLDVNMVNVKKDNLDLIGNILKLIDKYNMILKEI